MVEFAGMNPTVRHEIRTVIKWGVLAFLLVNAFSWNPGWGGRIDGKLGREVERYFGWPACFYCDLWRSDHEHEIALAAYFPAIPLSREMYFVYHSASIVAFLLNATLMACGTLIVVILLLAERKDMKSWMTPIGIGLVLIGLLIIGFGDEFSAYL